MKKHYIIGIDEAGRGPWAGPIVAGGWMADFSVASKLLGGLDGLDDSKLLIESKREKLFSEIERMQHRNECQFAFAYRDAPYIDTVGIREANRQCMQDVLLSLLQFIHESDSVEVFIDGCDNYQFDIGEMNIGYTFAEKKKKMRTPESRIHGGEGRKNYFCHSPQGESLSDISKGILALQEGQIIQNITYLIHGDALHPAISAGSIVAKVTRDRMMCDFHEDFPEYGFDSHKGYGTRKHSEALLHYGISTLHRKSYAPVKRLISLPVSL